MQSLRQASLLARLVLVWFVLAVGAAAASPLVQAQDLQVICSGGVAKLVSQDGDGSQPGGLKSTLDCPLCGTSAAPPPVCPGAHEPNAAGGHVAVAPSSTRIAALASPPLPARGPPSQLNVR